MKHWFRIGLFACSAMAVASVASAQVINEVLYDDASTDDQTFVEIKGDPGLDLTGYVLEGFNGNDGVIYKTVTLDGVIPASGYFVVGQAFGDQIADTDFQNGPDAVILRDATGTYLDAVAYGSGYNFFGGEGLETVDPPADSSISRCPDGSDTDNNAADFFADDTPTPGSANDVDCAQVPTGACCDPAAGCIIATAADCAGAGGEYLGDDTTCDPDPCTAQQVTICEVAADDSNGFPALFGALVEVTGTVISSNFSSSTNEYSITDGECCVAIFGGEMQNLNIGDEVLVSGTVDFYNGLTEVSIADLAVIGSGPVPAGVVVSTGDFATNGESYESCLVSFSCVTVVDGGDAWPADGSNANILIDDGSGVTTMRIDRDTDVDGSPAPTAPFSIIGIAGQFDSSSPYDEGYQVRPRFLADLTFDDPDCGPMHEGACCFADGSCTFGPVEDCDANGGNYQGDDTVCDPNPCSVVPVIEKSWGGVKDNFRR
ncbi:MAG: lamin tail domain-containing protein [Candidatus Eisenbacteria bacterium]|nr:lamin tail domain-containing protein [Candidatus Eisenbacteria bacterium]